MPGKHSTAPVVDIDGSYGEGGGQVLRTALALSALTGQPVQMSRVRVKRRNPGLAPQHLTAVMALATICDAHVEGAAIGSTELTFTPCVPPCAGTYAFDVAQRTPGGSAGSTGLLFQALLFPLVAARGTSHLTLKGGTHVKWSPTFDDLDQVYLPLLTRMGVHAHLHLEARGFYPRGGGHVHADVEGYSDSGEEGMRPLWPLTLIERGALQRIRGHAIAANLPAHIAHRMANRAEELLAGQRVPVDISRENVQGPGPGAVIHLTAEYDHVRAGFTGHGEQGKRSEIVAEEACRELLTHHESGAPIEPHLADQLLLPMALAEGRSTIRTSAVTAHLVTNAHIIRQFLPIEIEIAEAAGRVVVQT